MNLVASSLEKSEAERAFDHIVSQAARMTREDKVNWMREHTTRAFGINCIVNPFLRKDQYQLIYP